MDALARTPFLATNHAVVPFKLSEVDQICGSLRSILEKLSPDCSLTLLGLHSRFLNWGDPDAHGQYYENILVANSLEKLSATIQVTGAAQTVRAQMKDQGIKCVASTADEVGADLILLVTPMWSSGWFCAERVTALRRLSNRPIFMLRET